MSANSIESLINPDRMYTILELYTDCKIAGYPFSIWKLRNAVKQGQIETTQPGGKYHDHYVLGSDAIAFFLR